MSPLVVRFSYFIARFCGPASVYLCAVIMFIFCTPAQSDAYIYIDILIHYLLVELKIEYAFLGNHKQYAVGTFSSIYITCLTSLQHLMSLLHTCII